MSSDVYDKIDEESLRYSIDQGKLVPSKNDTSEAQVQENNIEGREGVQHLKWYRTESEKGYTLLPVDFIQYALSHKFVPPLRLYLYLKLNWGGQRKLVRGDITKVCRALNWDPKTFKSKLEKLLQINWVGFHQESGHYFIRGFNTIARRENFISKTGVEFRLKKDINNFKAFVAGAFICRLVRSQEGKKYSLERKSQRSVPDENQFPSFRVAASAIAVMLSISVSMARVLKTIARESGYIKIQENFADTGYTAKQALLFKKAFPEYAHRVRIFNRRVYLQECDTVMSLMKLRSRGNPDKEKNKVKVPTKEYTEINM